MNHIGYRTLVVDTAALASIEDWSTAPAPTEYTWTNLQ